MPPEAQYHLLPRVSDASISMASQVKASVSEAYISNGALPARNMAAGLPPKADITSTYVESAEVSDGVITLALQGTSIAALDAASIIFEPSTSNQTLTWTCKASGSQINQYVPADCRVPL